MAYLIVKAAISGVLIALASEIARRYPGWGALIASLPLVSILGMMWLWRDTHDLDRLGEHSAATFWFVLPSLPMFLVVPWLFKRGLGFWPALALGCVLDGRVVCGNGQSVAKIWHSIVMEDWQLSATLQR